MVSTLDPRVEVATGLREVVADWLHGAVSALSEGGTPRAVHEARKSCKRARAALDLVGGRSAREVSRQIAEAAREISHVRDADVMAKLVEEHGWAIEIPAVEDRDEVAVRAALALHEAELAAARLRYERVESADIDERLVHSWRSARKAMKHAGSSRAESSPGEEREVAFHDWRKRVKRLQAQCVLLSKHHTALSVHCRELDALQELLGEHHDLCVLRNLSPVARSDLLDEIEVREQRALTQGRSALALRPKEFTALLSEPDSSRP